VVDTWTREYLELGGIDWIEYVQIFENRGHDGASNPHPRRSGHRFCPTSGAETWPADHLARTGHCLLCDYIEARVGR